ncbi:UDENN domain-containing protein [Entamoeba marina]
MSEPLLDICSSPLERALTLTSSHLVSSFSIWGLPMDFHPSGFSFFKKTVNYKAQKLFCYPPESNLQEQFSSFIAPQGVNCTETSKLNCLMEPPKKYLLILPGETSTSFCVCIVRKELLAFPSDFISETQINKVFTLGQNPVIVDRIYCFVSECPHINALFSLLEDMERYDFYYKNNWLRSYYLRTGGNVSEKYVTDKQRMIDYVQKVINVQACELSDYNFTITIPPAPSRTFFRTTLYESLNPADKQAACSLQMIADYALPRLFIGVQIPVILSALSSLLCGNTVILVGSNSSLITSAVFGLLSLLYPFIWQGVLIPFVPLELQEFLESPVPSLYGTEVPKELVRVMGDVVQLEQGSIFDPSVEKKIMKTNAVVKHPLPFVSELSSALNSCVQATFSEVIKYRSFEERERALERIPHGKVVAFSSDIQQQIKHHLYDKLLSFVRNYCTNNGPVDLTQFQNGFPSIIKHDSHREFIKEFIQSQHFNVWWYKNRMYEMTKQSLVSSPSPISLGGSKVSSTQALSPCRTPDIRSVDDTPLTQSTKSEGNEKIAINAHPKPLPVVVNSSDKHKKHFSKEIIINSSSLKESTYNDQQNFDDDTSLENQINDTEKVTSDNPINTNDVKETNNTTKKESIELVGSPNELTEPKSPQTNETDTTVIDPLL